MSLVAYYFDGYDSGGEEWANNPGQMVDGDEDLFATTDAAEVQLCNSNTSDGTDLGVITKVEIRALIANTFSVYADLRPVFGGSSDGDLHTTSYGGPGTKGWSPYFDITTDTNAPSSWAWTDIRDMDMDAVAYEDHAAIYKIEIRVTYSEVVITPSVLSITGAVLAPTINVGYVVTPSTLSLTLTQQAPDINYGYVIYPGVLPLILALKEPSINIGNKISPSTLALVTSLNKPSTPEQWEEQPIKSSTWKKRTTPVDSWTKRDDRFGHWTERVDPDED